MNDQEMRASRAASFLVSTVLLALIAGKADAGDVSTPVEIDLHAHLFMQEGMTFLLRGDFDEPAKAGSWTSMVSTKMTRDSLDPSGLRLVVVSLYAHPILSRFTGSPKEWFSGTREPVKESLLRQIDQAERFVAGHPSWVIASEPTEARAALAAGKRVIVLSIETVEGALDDEAGRKLFVDEKRVRIATFLHLTPDRLGRGVALIPKLGMLSAPLEWISAWLGRTNDPATGAYVNAHGLSPFGKATLEALARRKVWIDLAHASDQATREMVPVLDRAGQPALYTHTKLREINTSERAVPRVALERVRDTRGILGLMPTDDMSDPLPPLPSKDGRVPPSEDCRRGIRAYAEEWARTVALVGSPSAVVLGSDFNAPLRGLRGGCDRLQGDPTLAASGFYRAEDLPRLFGMMKRLGVNFGKSPDAAIERFLAAWERVRAAPTVN
jgi:microsomal dipeptidase-like Zn-dependent dipeptidase